MDNDTNHTVFNPVIIGSIRIWTSKIETDHWKNFLKINLNTFVKETNSIIAQKILNNFDNELKKFKQVCPIEMLDKLENPISLKPRVKKAS